MKLHSLYRQNVYRAFGAALLLLSVIPMTGLCAVLYVEDFEGGANGWGDRDAGEMAVSHQAAVGSPASGAMQGIFPSQGFNSPQTDAFKISSGANFLGDYTGLTGFTFELYADTVLPSDAAVRIISGSDTFFYTLSLGSLALDTWTPFTVPLTYSSGWQGGEPAFNAGLLAVSQVEVQLTRNGTLQQFFYLDNFETTADNMGGGGGSSVPEPGSGVLVLFFGVVLCGVRKFRQFDPAAKGAFE